MSTATKPPHEEGPHRRREEGGPGGVSRFMADVGGGRGGVLRAPRRLARGFKRVIWKQDVELAGQIRLALFLYAVLLVVTLFLALGYRDVI